MKYYANFNANHGTHFERGISGTNKKRLTREIRAIAEAERFPGHRCYWFVEDINHVNPVAMGGMTETGKRYRSI